MPASRSSAQRGLSREEPRRRFTLERVARGPAELTQVLRHPATEGIGQARPGTTDLEQRVGCNCSPPDLAETLTALDFVQPYLPVKLEVMARNPRGGAPGQRHGCAGALAALDPSEEGSVIVRSVDRNVRGAPPRLRS